jgi:hypothetical protein
MIMIGTAIDRRALTEMLVDKIIIRARSTRTAGTTSSAPSHTKILSKEAERLEAVHGARVKIVPRV